jgi:hypothetical protein
VATDFVQLSAGLQYTCGVDRDETTWCWGGHLAARTKLEGSLQFTHLVGGRASDACGLSEGGKAYCWTFDQGDSWYDYYGEGTAQLSTPARIGGGRMFSALALGDAHTCGLEGDVSGRVVCWNALGPNGVVGREPVYVQRAGRP